MQSNPLQLPLPGSQVSSYSDPVGKVVGLDHGPLSAERARAILNEAQSDIEDIVATFRTLVDSRIEQAASHNMGSIFFTVPKNIHGHGMYDVALVGRKLAEDLDKSGFRVIGVPENFKVLWSRKAILESDPKKIQSQLLKFKKKEEKKDFIEIDDNAGCGAIVLPKQKTQLSMGKNVKIPVPTQSTKGKKRMI